MNAAACAVSLPAASAHSPPAPSTGPPRARRGRGRVHGVSQRQACLPQRANAHAARRPSPAAWHVHYMQALGSGRGRRRDEDATPLSLPLHVHERRSPQAQRARVDVESRAPRPRRHAVGMLSGRRGCAAPAAFSAPRQSAVKGRALRLTSLRLNFPPNGCLSQTKTTNARRKRVLVRSSNRGWKRPSRASRAGPQSAPRRAAAS